MNARRLISHEVLNNNSSVVTVCVNLDCTWVGFCSSRLTRSKWVSSKTITSLESDLRLEGVSRQRHGPSEEERMGNRTDLRHKVKNPYNRKRSIGVYTISNCVCRIWVNVDAILTSKNTSEGVTGVVNVQVSVECRGIIQNSCHGECGSNVCRAEDHVALSSTSLLGDSVCFALDLEQETLELLNTPASVGVNVEVELAFGSNVCLSTRTCSLVDSSDDFTVDLCQNLSGENVGEFCFCIQTVNCLQVLCEVSSEYSAFSARDLAVTATFSIEKPIVPKATPAPRSSDEAVSIPRPTPYAVPEAPVLPRSDGLVAVEPVSRHQTALLVLPTNISLGSSSATVCNVGICFIEECFCTILTVIAGAHCEDKSSRTIHWLNACEVISDQVRH